MGYTTDTFEKAVGEVKDKSPKRGFIQAVDLAINLKEVDLNKPENRLDEEVVLPYGRGRELKVAVIADGEMAHKAKNVADRVITSEELEEIAKEKRDAKKLANETDFFIAQTDIMTSIGKHLGPILGPRGKMPKPLPPNAPIEPLVERLKKTIRVKTKQKPIIHVSIGTEKMENSFLAENAEAIFSLLDRKLEKGHQNIKNVYIKLTMGPSIHVGDA